MRIANLIISFLIIFIPVKSLNAGNYVFSVKGNKTYLNNQEILIAGLRCSNALFTDQTTDDLINHLDEYSSYGVNTISVFVMGSRFGNIKGYNKDGSLNKVFLDRLAKIIEAADKKGMIVLVGCLYWGGSKAKWESWTQEEANRAIANTIFWLKENNFRNVFVDVDNEGMAMRKAGFDPAELVRAAKAVDPSFFIATNFKGIPPEEADLGIHFSYQTADRPYVESEGTPINAPGNYWGKFSRQKDLLNYINIGLYNEEMKANQIDMTREHFKNGWGYMLASTWLQCVPPYGPNAAPGGNGSVDKPGIRWWLEVVKEMRGEYIPPQKNVFGYYLEKEGMLCLEAEHYQQKIDRRHENHTPIHKWVKEHDMPGFSGEGYVSNLPDYHCEECPERLKSSKDNGGPELVWNVKVNNAGDYHIWIRAYSKGDESNGCHLVVDGTFEKNGPGTNITGFCPYNTWVWENKHKEYARPPVIHLAKGMHTIHLLGRDDGFRCDQILLVKDEELVPLKKMYPESLFVQIIN